MKVCKSLISFAGAVLFAFNSSPQVRAEVILGEPPTAPKDVSGLPKGAEIRSVTGGFSVDATSREQVRAFYNAVFLASEGVPIQTTANVGTCTPGTNSTAYKEAVLRRINWFRAMAGVPASVTFNSTFSAKNQEAAVIMSANNTLSHFPPPSWSCYTPNGANAASNSNIAIGNAGADAISAYIWDFGASNYEVGHRRWILYPQTQVMGTGDVPETSSFRSANAVWVFDGNYGGPRPVTRKAFVSWPPAGYLPYQLAYPYWSFALTNADLSAASVAMKSNGVNVAVSIQPYVAGFGENSVVWVPMGLNATTNTETFPFSGADTTYSITVTNIKYSTITTGFTYSVTLFDPNLPGSDFAPPIISGTTNPAVGVANAYTFTPITNASGYEWRVSQSSNYSLNDGAESGLGNFTAVTSPGYSVQDSGFKATGSYSFRLAHPDPAENQYLTLNQGFVPQVGCTLNVRSRLGYSADGETAHVQVSTDGRSWQDLFTQSGVGNGLSGPIDSSFVSRSFPLTSFQGQSIQLRFAYTYTPGYYSIYPQSTFPIGWYFDDITITNAEILNVLSTNLVTGTNFTFTPAIIGNYNLDVRAYLYTEFPLSWGPAKKVTAVAAPLSITMGRPVVSGGQVVLDFGTSGAASFKLLQADQAAGPWTTNASATLTTISAGSAYRFTTPVGPAMRFYQVKSP